MSVSFDIKFIRREQKLRRDGEAYRASPTCLCLSLINLISNYTYMVFYLSCIISRCNGGKQTQFFFKLADVGNVLWHKSVTSFNHRTLTLHP